MGTTSIKHSKLTTTDWNTASQRKQKYQRKRKRIYKNTINRIRAFAMLADLFELEEEIRVLSVEATSSLIMSINGNHESVKVTIDNRKLVIAAMIAKIEVKHCI